MSLTPEPSLALSSFLELMVSSQTVKAGMQVIPEGTMGSENFPPCSLSLASSNHIVRVSPATSVVLSPSLRGPLSMVPTFAKA